MIQIKRVLINIWNVAQSSEFYNNHKKIYDRSTCLYSQFLTNQFMAENNINEIMDTYQKFCLTAKKTNATINLQRGFSCNDTI